MEKMIKPGNVVEFLVTDINNDYQQIVYSYVCKENETGKDASDKDFISHITHNGYENKYKGDTVNTYIYEEEKIFKVNKIFSNAYEAREYILTQEQNSVNVGSVVEVNQGGYNYTYYIVEPNTDVKIKDGLTVINTNAPVYHYLKGKVAGEIDTKNPLVVLDDKIPVQINKVYKNIEEYNAIKRLKKECESEKNIKMGSIVDTTIDGSSFMLYLSDKKDENDNFTLVGKNTPLYNSLSGKTNGDTFAFNNFEGNINKVYPSLENYNLCMIEKEIVSLEEEIVKNLKD